MTKKQYAYLIIESTTKSVKIGDIVRDEDAKDQDYTWEVFNYKSGKPKYFRGLRLCEFPEDNKERVTLMTLIYKAMKNATSNNKKNNKK
jgi:hypothetical protein